MKRHGAWDLYYTLRDLPREFVVWVWWSRSSSWLRLVVTVNTFPYHFGKLTYRTEQLSESMWWSPFHKPHPRLTSSHKIIEETSTVAMNYDEKSGGTMLKIASYAATVGRMLPRASWTIPLHGKFNLRRSTSQWQGQQIRSSGSCTRQDPSSHIFLVSWTFHCLATMVGAETLFVLTAGPGSSQVQYRRICIGSYFLLCFFLPGNQRFSNALKSTRRLRWTGSHPNPPDTRTRYFRVENIRP